MSEEKKGFFAKALEFLTDREEKEELEQVESEVKALDEKLAKEADEKAAERRAAYLKRQVALAARQAARRRPTVKKHVVVAGDTLSALAKKYYGDAKMYMILYEANKETIGDNPSMIQIGMELVVPEEEE